MNHVARFLITNAQAEERIDVSKFFLRPLRSHPVGRGDCSVVAIKSCNCSLSALTLNSNWGESKSREQTTSGQTESRKTLPRCLCVLLLQTCIIVLCVTRDRCLDLLLATCFPRPAALHSCIAVCLSLSLCLSVRLSV